MDDCGAIFGSLFGDEEYRFRNSQEFNQFLDQLAQEKRFGELRRIKEKYGLALAALDRDYWQNDSLAKLDNALSRASLFDNLRQRLTACLDSDVSGMITVNGSPVIQKGDYLKFGRYPQSCFFVKKPIEWLALEVNGNEVLLISRYGLDCRQYHKDNEVKIDWDDCDLRKWLNEKFLKEAFTEKEQERIMLSEVANDISPEKVTQDRVFCLSLAESVRYFENNRKRQCRPTAVAKWHGTTWSNCNDGNCRWWLRSPGYVKRGESFAIREFATCVDSDGDTGVHSCSSQGAGGDAVRPAIRLVL